MDMLIFLLVIGTSVWVLFDAKALGVKKGQISGIANMGPTAWFFGCLLLWIVAFPLYLTKRDDFKRANGQDAGKGRIKTQAGWVVVLIVIGIFIFQLKNLVSPASAPACADNETRQLVTSIFMKEAKTQVRQNSEITAGRKVSDTQWDSNWTEIASRIVVRVENIRTKEFNKTVGSYFCAADLHYEFNGSNQTLPITYTSELASDKKGGFYVEVYGLH